MNSLEHNTAFHFVKRLVKIVAPEYRVFSSEALERNQCVLDLRLKTIEIGEGTEVLTAVGAILFQAGHLRLRKDSRFKEHFGNIDHLKDEAITIQKLARQGYMADKSSLNWAITVMSSNWNLHPSKSRTIIQQFTWTEKEWSDYYLKKS
jgi:hypothetical protein